MVVNTWRRVACVVLVLMLGGAPALAQSTGPIAASVVRISAETRLLNQGGGQTHFRHTCGKKVLMGLAVGAGAGAAFGTGVSLKAGEPAIVIPGMTVLFGLVGAAIGSHTCR